MSKISAIKSYLLQHLPKHPHDIVAVSANHFHVTRTTIHRHLNALIQQGKVVKSGTTRQIFYALAEDLHREITYIIAPTLDEFEVFKKDFYDLKNQLKRNVADIFDYGFTEIFNNAIEHSYGNKINVSVKYEDESLFLTIRDNGIGIFESIYTYFKLSDIRESIIHLSKGKVTTDPTDHTGEGIFFSSRAFDIMEIFANNLYYIRDNMNNDWSFHSLEKKTIGTAIRMKIRMDASQNLTDIFIRYQDEESLAFTKTDILVKLSQFEEETLMSRSQAKRIVLGLDKFNHITLDFTGIRLVGQGFADQIFRVFTNANPNVVLEYINANSDVQFMIERAIASKSN